MVIKSKTLITKRYTGDEFGQKTILNKGIEIDQFCDKIDGKLSESHRNLKRKPKSSVPTKY